MFTQDILIPPGPNFPLRPLWAGLNTSLPVTIPGLPAEVAGFDLILRYEGEEVYAFHAGRDSILWIEPYAVNQIRAGHYEVYALTDDGRRSYFGAGQFGVVPTSAGIVPPRPAPAPVGIFAPVGGALDAEGRQLYARLAVEIEPETGQSVAVVSEERYIFREGSYQEVSHV